MIAAFLLAVRQVLSPPFRAILLKSAGLAALGVIFLAVVFHTVLTRVITLPEEYALAVSLLTGVGSIIGAIFLLPATVSFIASLYADDVADRVEAVSYPGEPRGEALPFWAGLGHALKFTGIVLAVNLVALGLSFLPGLNVMVWWVANGYLFGREYFEQVAMRFRSAASAREMRRRHSGTVIAAGLAIGTLMAVPFVNLTVPVFAVVLMVHLHKRLAARDARAQIVFSG